MSTDASSRNPDGAAPLVVRDILDGAWSLFKTCLPLCLPLAVIGVAAGATPGAEAALSGAARGVAYGRDWWSLCVASTVLTLICYGAVLRQQLALAAGERLPLLDSLRRATMDVLRVLPLLLLLAVPLLPAMLVTALRGFGVWSGLLTLVAGALLIYGWFAWPALVARGSSPFTALQTSMKLVRGRWRGFALLAATLIAIVLVFVLLTGILIGVVMGVAGQAVPSAGGLALSRWLMAVLLAVPVVYAGAVSVTVWHTANR